MSVILYRSRLDAGGRAVIGTFRGNNLAFASGNAYLDVLRRENLLANVRAQGGTSSPGWRACSGPPA